MTWEGQPKHSGIDRRGEFGGAHVAEPLATTTRSSHASSEAEMNTAFLIAATLLSLVVSLGLTAVLSRTLPVWGFIDQPNERSSHASPTPRGGGLAIVVSTSIGLTAFVVLSDAALSNLVPLLPCAFLAAVGLRDDRRSLPAAVRLMAQVVASVALAAILAGGEFPMLLILVAGGYVVVIVNATNFMDGVNGISSLTGIVICLYFAVLASTVNSGPLMVGSLVLAASLLGFLVLNARGVIFMGDVGTYFIGAAFAGLSLWALYVGHNPALSLAPLMIYLADTLLALALKVVHGKPLLSSHKNHVYQRLNACGWSHLEVTLVVSGFTAFCAGSVLGFAILGLPLLGYALAASGVAGYLLLPRAISKRNGSRKSAGTTKDLSSEPRAQDSSEDATEVAGGGLEP